MKAIIIIVLFFMFSTNLVAGCSQYIDSVNINEVYKPKDGFLGGLMQTPFVEVGSVDGTDVNSSWTIRLSTPNGIYEYGVDTDSCNDSDYGGAEVNQDELDFNGMSISLLDENGDYIDYFVINGNDVEGHSGDCSYADDDDISFVNHTDADRDVFRDPDMSGDWKLEEESGIMSSFNDDDSECDSNDGSTTFYINDDGTASRNGDSCDNPNYNTITDALNGVKSSRSSGPFKLKVCNGTYDENILLDDGVFDGLVIKAEEDDVHLISDEDVVFKIDSADIKKVSLYGFNSIEHNASCGSSCSTTKYMFDFTKNADTSEAKISIGNIGTMIGGECNSFKFNSDFGGVHNFYKLRDMGFTCSAFDISQCDSSNDSFSFSTIGFGITSTKSDQFGFNFGSGVANDCNVSISNISLDMNQSSGIRFENRSSFELDSFYIKSHGKPIDLPSLDSVSLSNGMLELTSTDKNILTLDASGDVEINNVILRSNGYGFELQDGNPKFNGLKLEVNGGDADFSFKKDGSGVQSDGYIKNSNFGLKVNGNSFYWKDANDRVDMDNSCLCPTPKNDMGTVFNTEGQNYWVGGIAPNFSEATSDNECDGDSEFDSKCSEVVSVLNYSFDAFDTFRDINDRNISTKISGYDFNLTIASLDENSSDYQEFNGTVCVSIDTNTTKLLFSDQNTSTATFHLDKALQNTRVNISWKKDVDESCPLTNEDNTTTSTDNFAIRPKEFFVNFTPTTLKASESFDIKFVAGKDLTTPTEDYNESAGSSFSVETREHKTNCKTGTFSPDITNSWSFEDGSKTLSSKYDEVGVVDINITEDSKPCTSRFASVDCDDKNISGYWNTDTNLSIERKDTNVTINPYKFNITLSSKNFDESGGFTYLAQDINNMSAKADINITAQNKDLNITTNYNKECYANNIDINYTYSTVDSSLNKFLYLYNLNGVKTSTNNENINNTVSDTLDKSYFSTDHNGSAVFKIEYNFERDWSNPIDPFDINITSFDVKDTIFSDVNGSTADTTYTTFVYGRIMTKDVKTTQDDINHTIEIEIYSTTPSGYTSTLQQNSLLWWRHKNHNSVTDGNVTEMIPTKKTTLNSGEFSINDIANPNNGTIRAGISNSTEGRYIIHQKTKPWLWYIDKDFGNDYNDSLGSDCTKHPCFIYTLLKNNSSNSISSGSNSGGDIDVKSRGDHTRTGIKVYR